MKPHVLIGYDTETTGLLGKPVDGLTAGIIQIALVFYIDGVEKAYYNSFVDVSQYYRDVSINKRAMNINGIDINKVDEFPTPYEVIDEINTIMLDLNADFDKKAILFGYNNSAFDKVFLEDFYEHSNIKFNELFSYKQLDVFELLKMLQYTGEIPRTFNQKLSTCLTEYGIYTEEEVKEFSHDALWDVRATKQLWDKILELLHKSA